MIKIKPIHISIAIVLAVLLWVLSGFIFPSKTDIKPTEKAKPLPSVRGIELQKETFIQKIFATGISFIEKVNINAEVSAKILDIHATEGQFINAGDKILSLDEAELKSKFLNEKSNLSKAELDLSSQKKLNKKGLSSRSKLTSAQAGYELAKANYAIAKENLDNTVIKASESGILGSINFNIGDTPKLGKNITAIFQSDVVKVKSNISERYISDIKVGSKVSAEFNGKGYNGEVRYVSNEANPRTRSFPVEVALKDALELKDGQTAKLEIILNERDAFNVPNRALTLDNDGVVGIKYLSNCHPQLDRESREAPLGDSRLRGNDKLTGCVSYIPINLKFSGNDGFWVDSIEGLNSDKLNLITIGSGFVKHGDEAEFSLE